jgi:carbon monoxide dehydrogenase subunit G
LYNYGSWNVYYDDISSCCEKLRDRNGFAFSDDNKINMTTSITKTFEVDSDIESTWSNLSDPQKVVICVPGASLTEKVDDNNYKGEVELKFGPVKAKYAGLINFLERNATSHKMVLKGTGTDSKGKGGAEMKMEGNLSPKGTGTSVNVLMELNITGMLAQFGSRMINDVSNQVFDQFVNNFKKQLEGKDVDSRLHTGSLVGGVVKGIFGKK